MILKCKNKTFDLDLEAPPSKSIYHRELIVRFLCKDYDHLELLPGDNDDVIATKSCLKAILDAGDREEVILPCSESGSTLRFMIPVAAAVLLRGREMRLIFETRGRLFDRPLGELEDALRPHGISISKDDINRRIIVTGHMTPGEYVIDGSVSSQYISGLLMALPSFDEDSVIKVTGEMKSVHYIDLTLDVLAKYKAEIRADAGIYEIAGGGYKTCPKEEFKVEGDWSNGAFLYCLRKMAPRGNINITGLNMDSKQGDKAILKFLEKISGGEKNAVFASDDIPDIVPYMAVTAPFFFDKVTFTGIARLRIKECDRVRAIREQLDAIGVKTEETEDSLTVYRYASSVKEGDTLHLSSYADHRMAMTAVLIAVRLGNPVDIDNIECVSKSFPQLLEIVTREMT